MATAQSVADAVMTEVGYSCLDFSRGCAASPSRGPEKRQDWCYVCAVRDAVDKALAAETDENG